MVSQSCWRPLSREAGNQFAPPQAEVYSGAESPGRYFAAMVIFEVGWRERSSRAVVRPITPPPMIRKDAEFFFLDVREDQRWHHALCVSAHAFLGVFVG